MIVWEVNDVKYEFEDLYVSTRNLDFLPGREFEKISIIGRDGELVYIGAYKNKTINLECEYKGASISAIQSDIRNLSYILGQSGKLYLDYELDKYYEARLLAVQPMSPRDYSAGILFNIDINPIAKTELIPGTETWGATNLRWGTAYIQWSGYSTEFEFSAAGNFSVINEGNYISKPIYKITGNGNITLTKGGESVTIDNLSSTPIYVDTDSMTAYELSPLVNRIADVDGDQEDLHLQLGANIFSVSGAFTNVTVEVIYRHCWV